MRLEVEVEGCWMGDGTIDHQARNNVARLIDVVLIAWVLSEEPHVVLQVS